MSNARLEPKYIDAASNYCNSINTRRALVVIKASIHLDLGYSLTSKK
jgi:hypothetical protein